MFYRGVINPSKRLFPISQCHTAYRIRRGTTPHKLRIVRDCVPRRLTHSVARRFVKKSRFGSPVRL